MDHRLDTKEIIRIFLLIIIMCLGGGLPCLSFYCFNVYIQNKMK